MADLTTQWLADREALRALPQRYARAVDQRDLDALTELFDPDGTIEGVRGTAAVPEYLDGFRAPRAFATSLHVFAEPLIELEPGAERARLDSYALVHQCRAAGDEGDDLLLGMRYLDDVVRRDGHWVIHHRRAEAVFSRPLPRP
jgi:SnoaL-like domain